MVSLSTLSSLEIVVSLVIVLILVVVLVVLVVVSLVVLILIHVSASFRIYCLQLSELLVLLNLLLLSMILTSCWLSVTGSSMANRTKNMQNSLGTLVLIHSCIFRQ